MALLLASSLVACSKIEAPQFGAPLAMPLPAEGNVVGPRLSSSSDGTVVLSWMRREESGATLRFSSLEADNWQEAVDVVTDPKMFVNWADLPAVTPLAGGHWMTHWLSKSATATYAYDILIAQSADWGKSWSDPVRPHTDGTPTEHGFVSIHRTANSAALLWLDGRKMVNEATDDPKDSSMTLRSAVVDPTGTLSDEQLVDDIVCDCCQTDVAVSSKGPIAVYRNRTEDEIRDIYVTRFIDGRWDPGTAIADDGWEIAGCPVNGPTIEAQGDLVAIAWFSAANGSSVVQAVISADGGTTFDAPIEIASGRVSGHVDIAAIGPSSVAVSWVEADDSGSNAVNTRSLTTERHLGPVQTAGHTRLLRVHPQMVNHDDDLILAWTDAVDDATRITSVRIPIRGLRDR